MSRAFFVTGTDTEVGKTAVSCALLKAAAARGLTTSAVKPVAAGCDEQGQNDDALQLMDAMTQSLEYRQVNPVALLEAIAPHVAAAHEGRVIQASRLAGLCRGVMSGGADFVLIEGAGGWRVPINNRETLADVARELQVPVILVVGMRLGCINHSLLTAEAIQRDGLPFAGWVANRAEPEMACYDENLETLRRQLHAPFLGEIPHFSPWSADKASKCVDIAAIV